MIAVKRVLDICSISFLVLGIAWGAYWLLVAAYHCAPNVEDFALASAARDQGLFTILIDMLLSNYTRYTAAFFYGFNLLVFNQVKLFVWMPILCFLFFNLSFYYFISSFFHQIKTKQTLIVFTLLFVIIHFATQPSLPYGFTYMSSTFVYIYPWFFSFLWMGSFARAIKEENTLKKYFLSLFSYLTLILSFGCSELFIPMNAFFLLSFGCFLFLYTPKKWYIIAPHVLIAISSIGFILLCPSNKITSENIFYAIDERYNGSNFAWESLKIYSRFYALYLLHPLSLCFICVSTLLFIKIQKVLNWMAYIKSSLLIAFFMLSFIGSYLCTWPYFLAIGSNGVFPKYIFNCVEIYAQLGLWIIFPIFLSKKITSLQSIANVSFAQLVLASILLFLLFFSNNNIANIKREYDLGYLQDVQNKADKFYKNVLLAKESDSKNTVVYFENPTVIPKTIFLDYDVLPNRQSACWNLAYEDYFKINEVRLDGDTIFK